MAENPAGAIIEYAREHDFDLIAMATHGRGGLTQLVQGSVASAVVKSGVAPVMLIRPSKA
jgi:nucleotide-binding universal stress UspA family protein